MAVADPPISSVFYEEELRDSFLEYSMSVITSRALPDVRDGLKPVQRRVLYAMFREGHTADSKYTKCAGIVGEVLKRYHPHGDSSVYDTLVRLAQDWVVRYPLVDGQGNFGSIDGDSPAAYRYTEAKLAAISGDMLADIKKNTVDFGPNYNNTDVEPLVLPTKVPQLLINGCTGIAVGMATNIPPHNLDEVIDGCTFVMENPQCKVKDLFTIIKGPDFPTGGLILGRQDIREAYETGRGTIKMRGVVEVEDCGSGREAIVISALPYNVNKAKLIERIADLVKERKLEGIQELRDESDKKGMRIFVGLKKGALANLLVDKLYNLTSLQSNFGCNFVALVGGKPKTVTILDLISNFINHRKEVVRRRSLYDLQEARKRAHILEGLKKVLDFKDEYLKKILPVAKDKTSLKSTIEKRFELSDAQSEAIVILPNYRFSGMEVDKIVDEYNAVLKAIKELEELLGSEKKLVNVIKSELQDIKTRFTEKRRTKVVQDEGPMEASDLIPDDPSYVAMTATGCLKRYTIDAEPKSGSRVVQTGDDIVVMSEQTTLLAHLLPVMNDGTVYSLPVHTLSNMRRNAKGSPIQELVALKTPDAQVLKILCVRKFDTKDAFVVITTHKGMVKKVPIAEFADVRKSGVFLLRPGKRDELRSAFVAREKDTILFLSEDGKGFAVPVSQIPTGTKGVGGAHQFDSMKGFNFAGAVVMTPAMGGITSSGYFFTFGEKDAQGATAAKSVSIVRARKQPITHLVNVSPEAEVIAMGKKSGPHIIELGKRPTGIESDLSLKPNDAVGGLFTIHGAGSQMELNI